MNVIQFENKKLYSSQFMAIVEKPNHLTGEMQVFGNQSEVIHEPYQFIFTAKGGGSRKPSKSIGSISVNGK